MRIGINGRFYCAPVTGVQRFAREVATGIGRRAETVLLLPRDVRPSDVAPAAQVRPVSGHLRGHAWEQLELPQMARRAECDVVLHLSGTLPARGGPNVAVLHDVLPLTHPHLFAARFAAWYGLLLHRAVPRAAAIVTVSEQSRAAIARLLRPRRVDVVPQGLAPFDAPAPQRLVESVRASFGLPPAFLLAIGLGDRRKNLGFLPPVLDAYRARHGPPPPVIAVGNAAARVHGSVDLPAHADIRAVGRVTDGELHALYSGVRALLFPSIAEGFLRHALDRRGRGRPAEARRVGRVAGPVRARRVGGCDRLPARRRRTARTGDCSWAGRLRGTELGRDGGARPGDLRGRGNRRSLRTGGRARPERNVTRAAIVHDWLTGMRGGERVLEAMLDIVPDAEIFTLLHVPGSVSPRIETRPIHTSFIQRLPFAASRYRSYLPLFPTAVERLDLSDFDLVLSSSHCVAKGAIATGKHICYCHTPMRYVWDQYDAYFGAGRVGPAVRVAMRIAAPGLRRWDRESAQRPTRLVANSAFVRKRIRMYWGRDADVVHPPVDVERFTATEPREDWYLIVAALVAYKRIDIAVRAFSRDGRRLVVVGDGPELARLRALAAPNVTFTGRLPDEQVAALMSRCRAFVVPGEEDFGIATVEAQAAGAPVIAYGRGGSLETVIPHAPDGPCGTGIFFFEPTTDALAAAVTRFERTGFDAAVAASNARRFRAERFHERMRAQIDAALRD